MSRVFTYNKKNFKNLSFFIYGLGATGISTINFLKRRDAINYTVWDDNLKFRRKYRSKISSNIKKSLKSVDYIVLSPGINLKKSQYKKDLKKFRKKLITDIDLLYLSNNNFKSIVITGTNGKSTTCKIITHLLKKNNFKVQLGGNIGTPVLDLKIKKNFIIVIEASSFQLSHSKFIHPSYALLLNITNDHLDWHGSMQNYLQSKLKIFNLQKKNDFALINENLKKYYTRKKFSGKCLLIKKKDYLKIKNKIKNNYLKSNANDENMSFVYILSKLLKINTNTFIKTMSSFEGLAHRYEVFFKKKGVTFINDSKSTSFQSAKLALSGGQNIFWILGGLPKKNDKIILKHLKNKIIKTYIIGKNINFFKKQLKNSVKYTVSKNLKNAIISALRDIKLEKRFNNTILFSPGAASFDQFKNFEVRGDKFKELSKIYAKKFI